MLHQHNSSNIKIKKKTAAYLDTSNPNYRNIIYNFQFSIYNFQFTILTSISDSEESNEESGFEEKL